MPMIPALSFNVWWSPRTGETAWFSHYAAWKIADQMAKRQSSAQLYAEIVPAARQRASDEFASIQAIIDKQQGRFSAQSMGLGIYAEQVR